MVFNIDTNVLIAIAGGITSIAAAIVVVKKSVTNITKKVKSNIKQEMEEELKKNVIEPMYNKALETYNNDLAALKEHIDILSKNFEEQTTSILLEYRKMNKSSYDFRISTLKGLIVQSHSTYMQLGEIEPMVLSTLEDIYETYTSLGGNHFVGDLMEEIRALPKK
jgi:hypothetical protein